MDIIEAIRQRRSVRSFNSEPLNEATRKELLEFARSVENPFGGSFTVRLKQFDLKNGYKPTTYGMIKGATDFFLLGIDDREESALAAGFCFEQTVLKAWQMGLGTCWIAATFKGTDFATGEPWPEGERLRIVCPVGVPAKKSIMERLTRLTIGSANRKPFNELFFTDGFSRPLPEDSRFGESLEMMRLAPSSTNSQPWRALVDGDTVHFYYVPKSPASVLDCGIGLSHFYLAEKFRGREGRFTRSSAAPVEYKNWRYLISYSTPD